MSDLLIGLVLGYVAGTLGMLVTLSLTRHSGAAELVENAATTANGIPAP